MIKRIISVAMMVIMAVMMLSGCANGDISSSGNADKIVIWTSGEDYKNDNYLRGIQEQFPDYNFELEYMNSSTIAAKIMAEGEETQCDIILSNEYGYLEMCKEHLAVLNDFDFSIFLDEIVAADKTYTPEVKNGGAVIVNMDVLESRGLAVPESYEDLLDPQYEGLISMPNPTSSGTGYMFLRQLTNEWGEEEAFAYFEKLTENILQYTSSGSGPINALVQGEVAIGLGMTSQAVVEINQGSPLAILYFEEGSPYSMYGNAVLKKSADRADVMEVFEYLATEMCMDNHQKYFPDQIFKDYVADIEGFPKDIHYGDMKNDTLDEKNRLVDKWTLS